jgi:hypothetical protein
MPNVADDRNRVRPLFHTKEDVLLEKIGLDGVCFLRFLRMCQWMSVHPSYSMRIRATDGCENRFVGVAIMSCCVLIPINVAYNVQHNSKSIRSDPLRILTLQDVRGNLLYAHVAVRLLSGIHPLTDMLTRATQISYLITLFACYCIWRNYRSMARLRWTYFRSEEYQQSLHARSLMVP